MTEWSSDGFAEVGSYHFAPPYIPTIEQLEEAESFIFTQPRFEHLPESDRRMNVVRLAVYQAAVDTERGLDVVQLKDQLAEPVYIPLIAGNVKITSKLHEGVIIRKYELE